MNDIDTSPWPRATGTLDLGDLKLRSGGVLRGARIAWRSHGTLNAARDNVVLYPTSYSAHGADLEWLIGPHGVLDPTRWFILIPEMFGNGVSSSPSNTANYPALVTGWDNVGAQARLLREVWGIERLHAVYGWSMGAQQAYHWAAAFPEAVARIIIVCGSARTAVHNRIFLKSLMAVLEAAPEYDGAGGFSAAPTAALRAFGRIYAMMAMSQDFYRAGLHGPGPLDDFLRDAWEARYQLRQAADLLAQLRTWEAGDIAPGGDLAEALAAIKARVLLMPGETDLYFRVADNVAEMAHLKAGRLVPIPSIWGHRAGNPSTNPADADFIRALVRDFLDH